MTAVFTRSVRRAVAPWWAGVFAACAAAPSAPELPPPHETLTMASAALGETRTAHVWSPVADPSVALPTVYLLDGGVDEDFPHVAATLATLVADGALAPLRLVGVANTVRRRDLTSPTDVASDRAIAPVVGGAPAFRRFLVDELVPAIDARWRSAGERALVGESLAGRFAVETALLAPAAFARVVAFDPSLWWNDGELVRAAPARLRASVDSAPRVLWFASSSEPELAALAGALADALRAHAPTGLAWRHVPAPATTHATIFRACEADAYRAALWPGSAAGAVR